MQGSIVPEIVIEEAAPGAPTEEIAQVQSEVGKLYEPTPPRESTTRMIISSIEGVKFWKARGEPRGILVAMLPISLAISPFIAVAYYILMRLVAAR